MIFLHGQNRMNNWGRLNKFREKTAGADTVPVRYRTFTGAAAYRTRIFAPAYPINIDTHVLGRNVEP